MGWDLSAWNNHWLVSCAPRTTPRLHSGSNHFDGNRVWYCRILDVSDKAVLMAGVCFLPDFGAMLDNLSKLLDRTERLLILLLIIVCVLVGGLIVANILGGRGRG